jgi:hypothetical protein
LRRLTPKLVVAALAVGAGYAGARVLWPAKSPAMALATPTPAAAGSVDLGFGAGDAIVSQALDYLDRRPNIAVKVRQSLRLDGQQLSGSGAYWHQGRGNQRRTCWQLQTLSDGETTFFTQVFDGEKLWTDRRTVALRSVTSVDMPTVRRALAALQQPGPAVSSAVVNQQELLVRGGLTQLVAELHRCFTFSEQRTLQRGEGAVMALVGQWRPEHLMRLWPALAEEGSAWPEHLPHHVLLYLGADDFFPYLIEYRSSAAAPLMTSDAVFAAQADPLASYEFIDVQFAASMPDHAFTFDPPPDRRDVTGVALERLRPTPPLPAAEPADALPVALRGGQVR